MTIIPGYFVKGKGRPLVLLHCSMSSKEQWLGLASLLKEKFKVIGIDLYGYGQSPFPENTVNFTLDNEIELIEKVLENVLEKNEKFHLAGHSYGGAVAMKYSTLERKRNISLCVFEPMLNHVFKEIDYETFLLGKEFISEIENDVLSGNPKKGCIKFIDLFSGDGTFEKLPSEIQQIFMNCIKKMPMDYKATIDEKLNSSIYKKIDIPVCLISGEKSPDITSKISRFIAGVIPGITHFEINGGHMSPIENSKLFNPIVKNFFCSLDKK
ncbi:MAG: alpha/beta fold hydrolase [Desulforegulaceae bacterium]|nr:alpha/beta fold hydrolase [Desulforegulaceae bacterium]